MKVVVVDDVDGDDDDMIYITKYKCILRNRRSVLRILSLEREMAYVSK